MTNRAIEIVAILFCFELAAFLIIVPWTELWESNLLFAYVPESRAFMLHPLIRGGVAALGCLNFLIGVSAARRFFRPRRA